MEMMKAYLTECLLFGKPFEGLVMPNWILGVLSWINIGVIVFAIIYKTK